MEDKFVPALGRRASTARPSFDPVLAGLRSNHLDFDPRHRQAVVDRYSVRAEEARQIGTALRQRVERGDAQAMACCIGALCGLAPTKVLEIVVNANCELFRPACWLDVVGGRMYYDLDRVVERAALAPVRSAAIPATREVSLRLPGFLHAELLRRYGSCPTSKRLADLLGRIAFDGRVALVSGPGHRLKLTFARWRKSLGVLLIDQGVHAVAAAAAVLDFQIATKSNFAYVTLPAVDIEQAQRVLFATLGWEEAGDCLVQAPSLQLLAVGSISTPRPEAVTRNFAASRAQVESRVPGPRTEATALLEYHNVYTMYAAMYVAFATGARQLSNFYWPASHTEERWFLPFADKRSSATGRARAMVLCTGACQQISAYRCHCIALARRLAATRALDDPLRTYLANIEAERNVPLFFLVGRGGQPRGIRTNDFQSKLPADCHLAPDAGRHYFGTHLYRYGVREPLIGIYLRHAEAGVESLSSTSTKSLRAARDEIGPIIDEELARLRVVPVVGLGSAGLAKP